ncbi:hypothetical protein HID58_071342 [Brassica napus]|uniref:BnaCnng47470D protein n=2 Tax=Brassica napus TaxID=3708 RepID=A0A078JJK2_BRANA|nr:hypothetical protein HID58_071342 [Brassica napus]CAF2059094.1 unnamed protein product [Brassica napus]CDY65527.1 BnaCnng47470D [Brassica napus]
MCLSTHPRVQKSLYDRIGRLSKHLVEPTKYFRIAVSFGSVKSLISMPCFMSHASIPAALREARGMTEDLVRISTGIEDADDYL